MLYESAHVRLASEYRIATLTLDAAGQEHNRLSRAVLADLDDALRVAQGQPTLDVLVLRSGKETGFGAGPDLGEFAELDDPTEVVALVALGQRVARRLAELEAVTVAFIDGPCLGGALELALACDWRVGAGGPTTRVGFPLVRRGAVPCWGGTVRLPRLVGLKAALDLFLTGRKLSAAQARAIGLIDRAAGPRLATVHLDSFVLDLQVTGRKRADRPRLVDRLPGRRRVQLRRAWLRVERTTSADHAAPRELLRAVAAGVHGGPAEGFAAERAAMGRLAPALAASGALVAPAPAEPRPARTVASLRLRSDIPRPAKPPAADVPPIRRVGLIGGGTVGAALAQWAALHGCGAAVQERSPRAAAAARERLTAQFRQAVEKRLLPVDDAAGKLTAIPCGVDWVGFEDVDLVIEAVGEDRALKRRVLADAEQRVPPAALFATTTTALTVRELQERLARPGRLVGLHLGHPAAALKAAEVAAGPLTEPMAVARLRAWLHAHGKRAVFVADRPGRALGRVLLPYLHEAVLLAEEGFAVPAVDAALRRFGMAWGPFEALDAAGLDVVLATLRTLTLAAPALSPPPLLERLVAGGCRGRKTRHGFYRYDRAAPAANATVLPRPVACRGPEEAVPRAIARLVNAAFAGLGEGLVRDSATLDGLLLGAGWPAFRGGPLRYATVRGLPALLDELTGLAERHGPRFTPSRELRRRAGRPAERRRVVA
jgi:3-hydroxyacyl-CoA dehydrogenase/enoyl-CoA hydratase/3-hydroxybutyryl-CoA epimerase